MNPKQNKNFIGKENLHSPEQTEDQMISCLKEQFSLLAAWNVRNLNLDPEQVRKNIETMLVIFTHLPSCPGSPESH